ncbi:MAG: hypothetical protein AAGG02_00915 [Cyanobacteria bacterium P01_H01_bin.15]
MSDPIIWFELTALGLVLSLISVFLMLLPTLQAVMQAARSAEKLFDTLEKEFPPTLEALRLTGHDISELTDGLDQGVRGATNVVKQVDGSLNQAATQLGQVSLQTQGVWKGLRAAWQTFRAQPTRHQPGSARDFKPFEEP